MSERTATPPGLNARILRLAIPAFGALVAEPLFLLADTAMIGHLGAVPLAGLGVASTILQTVVSLCVFLAYTSTPRVARRLGAGDEPGAVRAGIEAMWLGIGLGAVLGVLGLLSARALPALITSDEAEQAPAGDYLFISSFGLPAMLLVIAATGLLRGLQDTRTPLIVSIGGFAANIALNAGFIYGLGMGVAGSALGTVVAQWGMALVYVAIALRAARRTGASLHPGIGGVRRAIVDSSYMLLRTVELRAVFVALTVVAGLAGVHELAALQILITAFSLYAFALDAIAIAAQAIVGNELGAGRADELHALTRRMVLWGVGSGVVFGALGLVLATTIGALFTSDEAVLAMLPIGFAMMAASAPLAGWVFVLDGVLIGAGDLRYLALAGLIPAALSIAAAVAVGATALSGVPFIAALWSVFIVPFLGGRAAILSVRARGEAWMRTGTAA